MGYELEVNKEVASLKRLKKDSDPSLSTRLKYIITEVEGDSSKSTIRDFVDNYLLARDARALREEINKVSPDIDLTFFPQGSDEGKPIPIGINLFWPDA